MQFINKKDFRELLKIHMDSEETDLEKIEGKGALNFLAIDDLPVVKEGERIDPNSVIQLRFVEDRPVFPEMEQSATDPFEEEIHFVDISNRPHR